MMVAQQDLNETPSSISMSGSKIPFPWKLHRLLEESDSKGFDHIISWLPDGCSFAIKDPVAFSEQVASQYFNQTKFKSFTRQLYLYGFLKYKEGPKEGAFYHPKFIRGQKESCLALRRNTKFGVDRRLSNKKRKQQASKNNNSAVAAFQSTGTGRLPKVPRFALGKEGGRRKTFDEIFAEALEVVEEDDFLLEPIQFSPSPPSMVVSGTVPADGDDHEPIEFSLSPSMVVSGSLPPDGLTTGGDLLEPRPIEEMLCWETPLPLGLFE